jgi:PIN domain nuclease of toxin-antitoxin system
MLLLDTHVWLWMAENERPFTPSTQAAIRQAVAEDSLFLCPISLWEVSLKASRGQLQLGLPLRVWMSQALDFPGLHLVPISGEIACSCAELPSDFHGDPADRLIAATARAEGMILLTHDKKLLKLAKQGLFKAIAV